MSIDPPLAEYIKHLFVGKQMEVVQPKVEFNAGETAPISTTHHKTKVLPLAVVRKELFYPEREASKETSVYMKELGEVAASAFLRELRDPRKVTHQYLTSQNGRKCWRNTSEAEKKKAVGIRAVNDPCESSFGGLTNELETFSTIKIQHAGAVDQVRRNGDLKRDSAVQKKSKQKEKGLSKGMEYHVSCTFLFFLASNLFLSLFLP